MKFLSATQIFNGHYFLPPDSVLVLDDKNRFIETISGLHLDSSKVERRDGIICPGFVNAHCHLELSHFKNIIEQKTGILNFAKGIITKRNNFNPERIREAISEADKQMWKNGIVAVGDICNTSDSFLQKSTSGIYYHSFIELIGFDPENADSVLMKGKEILKEAERLNLKASLAPHAPYSVSEKLLKKMAEESEKRNVPLTIHNQESDEENEFFKEKKGAFTGLYEFLKMPIDFFKPSGCSSLRTYLGYLAKAPGLILVHNTFTTADDIRWANKFCSGKRKLFWCFCPAANLYIENKLPEVNTFISEKCEIVVGTDSLASNLNLSITEELNILLKNAESLSVENALKWSIYNGAQALGVQDCFGAFIPNKNAGLNLLSSIGNQLYFKEKLA